MPGRFINFNEIPEYSWDIHEYATEIHDHLIQDFMNIHTYNEQKSFTLNSHHFTINGKTWYSTSLGLVTT